MRIGFSVQGSTDRAVITGLKARWCPHADLIEGSFRGSTREALRREFRSICAEFVAKTVDVMIFLTDSDGAAWRGVQQNERNHFPPDRLGFAIHGVADRNIECWLCLDRTWLAHQLNVNPAVFYVADPKVAFEAAMGIDRDDRKETEIANLILIAPLRAWIQERSFEDFYEQVRAKSNQLGCDIENLRDAGSSN